jgi:hypothetical protein
MRRLCLPLSSALYLFNGESMSINYVKIAIIATLLLFTNLTFSSEITYERLVGTWKKESTFASGAKMVFQYEMKADHTFSGTASKNGAVIWTFDGKCELKGNELIWTYLHSSEAMPQDYHDTDLILSIEDNSYSYKSMLSGNTGIYERVK